MMRRRRTARYSGASAQADLERVFFLDDEDRTLVDRRRGDHMKPGFALQLVYPISLRALIDHEFQCRGG